MPNVLSKIFAGTLRFDLCHAECHELSHTWNPNCLLAIWDALGPSLLFCMKTYGTLYLLKALVDVRGHFYKIDWKKLTSKTVRSSLFLTSTEILFMLWLCVFRRFLGFATWPTVSFVNGFFACAISIWIESKQRRAMLIPYLLNLASEAVYRQALRRNLCRPVPFGESIIFGLSLGLMVMLVCSRRPNQQPAPPNDRRRPSSQASNDANAARSSSSANFIRSILRHTHGIDIGIAGAERNTLVGVGQDQTPAAQTPTMEKAIKLACKNFCLALSILSVSNIFKRLFTRRTRAAVAWWPSPRLPLFLGALPLLTKLIHSLPIPKATITRGTTWSMKMPFCAGLASSLAMALCWPNNTLALYAFWKMIELVYYRLVSADAIPAAIPGGDVLLFCAVSSYLLGLAVLEPHALRPSYYKFLCGLTGNRLQLFNRPLFDKMFATNSSGYHLNSKYAQLLNFPAHLLTINPALYSSPIHF